ncbi:MAG: hypothetical protein J0H42_25705 [Rhizobiales bacterium]|nr:hypothetical protein [Hyphomicrobiales bacterium]
MNDENSNKENSIKENAVLDDAALDEVNGGFNFGAAFGIPSLPHLHHAPTAKSITHEIAKSVISSNPIAAIGHKLKFW